MSIIRLSAIRQSLFAPDDRGNLVEGDFDPTALTGELGFFAPNVGSEDRVPESALGSGALDQLMAKTLATRAAKLTRGAPAVVMVHGFLFDPRQVVRGNPADNDNPHGRLYHFQDLPEPSEIRDHTTGWPLRLGFLEDDGGENGLVIAFGWHSQPGFATSLIQRFENFYSRAYDYAGEAAWCLVATLSALARARPDLDIDLFCHSLGSRVVVRALALGAKHRQAWLAGIRRVLVLGGAEYTGEANLMYRRLVEATAGVPADQGPFIYNIVSRENDVLDTLAENFGPKSFFSSTQVIGHNGLEAAKHAARWMDLQIDGGRLRLWAAKRGFDISGDQPGNVWDHWYYYTHRGNMRFYQDILRNRAAWSFQALRTGDAIPEGVAVGFFGD